ncbi:MAG: DUF3368 domain-containing protein [Oculatellaceae cyanobacterium bins.114]|nr:DUF3368 domain-containing protein [Oculatellaceae cyanobacterium bins.114]
MIVVSDTSPLCNLAIANHLWLLQAIYGNVVIPEVVASELANAQDLPDVQSILTLDWIQISSLTNVDLATQLERDRNLDPGEAAAIALAVELQADDLLIDERLGRQEALSLGLSVIGILGILLVAKQRRLIQDIQPVLDVLINQANFYVSDRLYNQILKAAGEEDMP